MLQQISEIEAHSRGAIPALHTEEYDGWHLRFARNHTRRANSVNVLTPGILPLSEKIRHCEAAYERAEQPCHFRLTPLSDPDLDDELAARGYGFFGETEVRVLNLPQLELPEINRDLLVADRYSENWLSGLAALTGQNMEKQAVFREMLDHINMDIHCLGVLQGTKIAACGLGVSSSTHLGLFEFATHPKYRRQGLAARIAWHLLSEAKKAGLEWAYLQVVKSNKAAIDFWERIGFSEPLYTYHYRTKS